LKIANRGCKFQEKFLRFNGWIFTSLNSIRASLGPGDPFRRYLGVARPR